MGYYMRYFVTDDKPVTVDILESALKSADAAYSIDDKGVDIREYGVLVYGGELYGELDINRPNDGLFEEEITEFRESFEDEPQIDARAVLDSLANTKTIVAVKVLWQGRDSESTLNRIDPLWDWLKANRAGIQHADGEGFYTEDGLVPDVR